MKSLLATREVCATVGLAMLEEVHCGYHSRRSNVCLPTIIYISPGVVVPFVVARAIQPFRSTSTGVAHLRRLQK